MTTPAHDPFRGAVHDATPAFPQTRLEAAGLTPDQLELERARFADLGRQRQLGYLAHADRAADDDLLAAAVELERSSFDSSRLLVDDVLDRVKADPDLLPYALESERSRGTKTRKTLVAGLEELADEQRADRLAEELAAAEQRQQDEQGGAAHRVGELVDPGGPTGPEAIGDHGTTGSAPDAVDSTADATPADPSLLTEPEYVTPATDGVTGEPIDDVAPALTPAGTGGEVRTDELSDPS